MPDKWGVLISRGLEKVPKFNKRRIKIGEKKQAVVKHKTKIYTEACYIAMKIGRK